MKTQNQGCRSERNSPAGWRFLLCAGLCAVLSLGVLPLAAQDKGINVSIQTKDGGDAGLMVSAQATAKEVGLPLYPGSRPHKEKGEESSAAKLGLWGSSFGFKLVILKMESDDPAEKVAEFYLKALAKYGKVLNCGDSEKAQSEKGKKSSSNELTCDDDKPDPGGMLFKAGRKEKQHIVSVKPYGTGCIFELVFLETRDKEKAPA